MQISYVSLIRVLVIIYDVSKPQTEKKTPS